jgi:adenosylcobinamide-phosphate synthase
VSGARAIGLLLGYAADGLFGDPRRGHPVAAFGRAAAKAEKLLYRDHKVPGFVHSAVLSGGAVALGIVVERAGQRRPVLQMLSTAAATWVVLGGASLAEQGTAIGGELDSGDIAAARDRLPSLCGRDPHTLDQTGLARAAVESVAENTSDAVVAPLFWGAIAGVPGLLGYRAVNTLDAMVGHRSERYREFGTASARLDDLANLLPSRLTALLTAAVAPLAGGDGRGALRMWWRDGDRHPSPNSGQCEAAMAGALGVRLGGTNVYHGRVETRPYLGDGAPPGPADLRRAARISGAVGVAALAVCAGFRAAKCRRR